MSARRATLVASIAAGLITGLAAVLGFGAVHAWAAGVIRRRLVGHSDRSQAAG